MLNLGLFLNGILDDRAHFVNCVHFSLLGHLDPVIKFLIGVDGLLSGVLKTVNCPVADLNKTETEERLFNFNCLTHFLDVLTFFDGRVRLSVLSGRGTFLGWRSLLALLVSSTCCGNLSDVRHHLLLKRHLKKFLKSRVRIVLDLGGIAVLSKNLNLWHFLAFKCEF